MDRYLHSCHRYVMVTMAFSLAAYLNCIGWSHRALGDPPLVTGFEIAWFDDFDGPELDSSKWTVANTPITTNFSLQDYLPEQVSLSDGKLIITSEERASRGRDYVSGLVTSTARQQYGRWDVRAKLPTGTGAWPAIWLLSDVQANPWPSQGEIDIMENRGNQPNVTSSAFHYGTNPPYDPRFIAREQSSVAGGIQANYHTNFHDYAVEWTPSQIRFYVDDVHHATVYDADTGGFISNQSDPMNLILNTAIGGTFLQDPDGTASWPQTFEVEHVYAYSQSGQPIMAFENGSFDDNGGSLAHWSTFGNSVEAGTNVRGDTQRVRSGDGSLKLYGQFSGNSNFSGVEQGISVTPGDELMVELNSFIDSQDSIFGTDNRGLVNIDYYSEQYGQYGSSSYLGSDSLEFANGSTVNDQWLEHQLTSFAPTGAIEARLAIVFHQPNQAAGAIHVDNVQFGFATAIPEPGSAMFIAGCVALVMMMRRRSSHIDD
ncbi:MAG: glycoside hydrolase family 16 protein [Planctomycetota bacterium]